MKVQGDGAAGEIAAALALFQSREIRGRADRRARRRLARRSVGVQRRNRRARDCRIGDSGDHRRGPRNRFHHRRFRGGPARSHAFRRRGNRGALAPGIRAAHRRLSAPTGPSHALPAFQRRHRVRDLQTHRGFRQLELLRAAVTASRSTSFPPRSPWACACGSPSRSSGSRKRARGFLPSTCAPAPACCAAASSSSKRALRTALERVVTQKRRRFSAAHLRFAALDLRARVGKLRRVCEQRSAELRARMDRLLIARRRRLEAAASQLQRTQPVPDCSNAATPSPTTPPAACCARPIRWKSGTKSPYDWLAGSSMQPSATKRSRSKRKRKRGPSKF